MTEPFAVLAELVVDDLLRLQPEHATDLGDHRHDGWLDDHSAQGTTAAARVLRERCDDLDSLDLDVLGPQDAVDAEILRHGVDARLFALEQLREPTWNPLVWLPGNALWSLLARDTVPLADRVTALQLRLQQVPERMLTAEQELQEMPRVHVETALTQLGGVRSLVVDEAPRLSAADGRDVGAETRAAAAALDRYRDFLLDRLAAADRDPRLGAELFAAKLHLTLDADLTAQQVVAAARENLERVTEELTQVASDWTGSSGDDVVREALDRVALEVPDDASIVLLAQQTLDETTAAVREAGFVTVPQDFGCTIQEMPEFRRGVAVAYCDAPGPLEHGGETYYAISPTPRDWDDARVTSFYREYNTAMITNLTVHEAMPGHVLQLAHARRFRGSTRVRQVLASGSFIEGWAVHAERLLVERGHGGVPVRLQQLKMQLRMSINALLDAGVHAGGMTEQEALGLMTGAGFQEEGEAVGKWRRALLTSGQLSTYFVGFLELDPVLRGRPSYDEVLAHGSPPPRHLPALLAG